MSASRVVGKVVARLRVDWRRTTRSSERNERKNIVGDGVGVGRWSEWIRGCVTCVGIRGGVYSWFGTGPNESCARGGEERGEGP